MSDDSSPLRGPSLKLGMMGVGVFLLSLGLAALVTRPVADVVLFLGVILGALIVHSARVLQRSKEAMALYRDLRALLQRNDLDGAERLLLIMRTAPNGNDDHIRRVSGAVGAAVASTRGDFARAEAVATETIAIPNTLGVWDKVLTLEARSHRALANAALGHAIGEDQPAIASSPHASALVRARLEVAHGVAHAKKNDLAALRELTTRSASLVLDHGGPHERALFRTLSAYGESSNSAYREPPRAMDGSKLRPWLEKVSPALAVYAPNEPAPTPKAAETPSSSRDEEKRSEATLAARLAKAPTRPVQPVNRAFNVAFSVAVACAALFVGGITAIGVVVAGLLGLGIASYVRTYRNVSQNHILRAERDLVGGRVDVARQTLRKVADAGLSTGASAGHHLAVLANRLGEPTVALEEVQQALALCKHRSVLDVTREFVLPGLLAESAAAFAMIDRHDEAEEELATLEQAFPSYAHRDATLFRVRLISAMRCGDFESAAAIAANRRPELALDFGIEVLADLALGDRSFEADLARAPITAAWIAKIVRSERKRVSDADTNRATDELAHRAGVGDDGGVTVLDRADVTPPPVHEDLTPETAAISRQRV